MWGEGMELKDFVQKSLEEIIERVSAVQQTHGEIIAPSEHEKSQLVEFEISVTASDNGSAGIKILSFAELKAGVATDSINRLQFRVPIYLQRNIKDDQAGGDKIS